MIMSSFDCEFVVKYPVRKCNPESSIKFVSEQNIDYYF
jgi:hypothetical protein